MQRAIIRVKQKGKPEETLYTQNAIQTRVLLMMISQSESVESFDYELYEDDEDETEEAINLLMRRGGKNDNRESN